MNKLLAFCIIMSMLLLTSIGVTASFGNGWGEYCDDLDRNCVSDSTLTGFFSTGTQNIPIALQNSPDNRVISTDIDSDGFLEYITIDKTSASLIAYNASEISIQKEYEIAILDAAPEGLSFQAIDFGSTIIVSAQDNTDHLWIKQFQVSGGNFVETQTFDTTNTFRLKSNPACDTFTTAPTGDYCYIAAQRISDSKMLIERYNITDGQISDNSGAVATSPIFNSEVIAPAIADMDGDGFKEIVFTDDVGGSGDRIVVFNHSTFDYTIIDTYTLDSDASEESISSLSIINPDGGNSEILVTYQQTISPYAIAVEIINYPAMTQNRIWVLGHGNASSIYTISNMVLADFIFGSSSEFCAASQKNDTVGSSDYFGIDCLNTGTESSEDLTGAWNQNDWEDWVDDNEDSGFLWRAFDINEDNSAKFMDNYIGIIADDMDESRDAKKDIITSSNVFFTDRIMRATAIDPDNDYVLGDTYIAINENDLNGTGSMDGSFNLVSDVNNDNLVDICGTTTTFTYCAFSIAQNTQAQYVGPFGSTIPIKDDNDNVQIDRAAEYTDVCIGSNHTFYAEECENPANGNKNTGCNYADRVTLSDTERLVTTCPDGFEVSTNFSSTGANQDLSFTCNFSTIGPKTLRVFIQDDKNSDDFSSYLDVVVNVINGTRFSDCDLAPSPSDILPKNTTQTLEDPSEDQNITPLVETGDLLPGAPCTSGSDCTTGLCDGFQCAYRLSYQLCTADSQCLSGICVNQMCGPANAIQSGEELVGRYVGRDAVVFNIISWICVLGLTFIVGLALGLGGFDFLTAGLAGLGTFVFSQIVFAGIGWMSPWYILIEGIFILMVFFIVFITRGNNQ